MPLTKKGKSVMASMKKTYKSKEKAQRVFYSMINAGKLKGAERKKKKR